MAYIATLQQIQRNPNADSIDLTVRFDGSGPSAGNSIVKTFSYQASTMPEKAAFKATIAAAITAMTAFDAQVAFLNGQTGKDISTI